MHSEWKELIKHTVVSIEEIQSDVKQLVPPKKVILCCPQHQVRSLTSTVRHVKNSSVYTAPSRYTRIIITTWWGTPLRDTKKR